MTPTVAPAAPEPGEEVRKDGVRGIAETSGLPGAGRMLVGDPGASARFDDCFSSIDVVCRARATVGRRASGEGQAASGRRQGQRGQRSRRTRTGGNRMEDRK